MLPLVFANKFEVLDMKLTYYIDNPQVLWRHVCHQHRLEEDVRPDLVPMILAFAHVVMQMAD